MRSNAESLLDLFSTVGAVLGSVVGWNGNHWYTRYYAEIHQPLSRLVLTHKDRLLRFGSELVFSLCEQFGVEVVIINRTADSTSEEDLAKDVLEIITVFSARLYGSRSKKNR